MASNGFLSSLVSIGLGLLRGSGSRAARRTSPKRPRPSATRESRALGGGLDGTDTIEVDPRGVRDLRLAYAPHRDDAPDAGEIVWTWVPYVENDGRGKDRPVLVIGRHTADRVYAVKLTSKNKPGRDDRLGIGSGPWDARGRPSWVDTDQLYSVHRDGMRREAAALDLDRFSKVALVLQHEFGWPAA